MGPAGFAESTGLGSEGESPYPEGAQGVQRQMTEAPGDRLDLNRPVLTLDIDWAPDFMIKTVAARLLEAGVCATWFVTHDSPAVRQLKTNPDRLELGLHPNFLPGSTHGTTPEEVLSYVSELVPGARAVRTHGLISSTQLLDLMIVRAGLEADVTLFLPRTTGLKPFEYYWRGRSLWRVPFFWEDDFEMERAEPCWDLEPYLALGPGLKVFNFHPIHVYLNSADMGPYQQLKKAAPNLREASPELAARFINQGSGAGTLFDMLVAHLVKFGSSCTISQLVGAWRRS